MSNPKTLFIFYSLFRKEFNETDSSLYIYSFLKNMSNAFLKKIYIQHFKILYSFFLVTKRILTRHQLSKSVIDSKTTQNNFSSIGFYKINYLYFFKLYFNSQLKLIIQWSKNLLLWYKKYFFLYNIYIYLSTHLLYFKYSIISFPKVIRKKTVLRSPHIDKRSREQFERITRHSFMYLPFFFFDFSSIIYASSSFGMEIAQRITLKR